ncbi:hypothetical protein Y1Q_0013257 [Alligator mississippiensis]|uniref:Uncharacterized protein n=1 Tax=Alligator mississippiensis TaxID=8496 RepID=A0A151PFK5_ALLMI|nr:hypothetical protein Y1Q_0013257 [Alligator mississippiensis]
MFRSTACQPEPTAGLEIGAARVPVSHVRSSSNPDSLILSQETSTEPYPAPVQLAPPSLGPPEHIGAPRFLLPSNVARSILNKSFKRDLGSS